MTTLPAEDRKTIVEQHLKNVLLSEYNINLSLLESNAMTNKPEDNITALNAQLADIALQKTALQTELDSINAEIAAEQSK